MKFGRQISTIAVLLAVAVSSSSSHIVNLETGSNFQYNAELVEVAPLIDGFLNDTPWQNVEEAEMEQESMENRKWQNTSDFNGSFIGVWRNGFLYIAVRLTDNNIDTHKTKLSYQDHLVIYLDSDHNGHKSEQYRYNLPVGQNNQTFPSTPLTAIAWGNDGESCELMFNLGHIARKGNAIGFWLYYNDVDAGRIRQQVSWGPPGHTVDEEFLPDLVFATNINAGANHKVLQWGRVKSLYN